MIITIAIDDMIVTSNMRGSIMFRQEGGVVRNNRSQKSMSQERVNSIVNKWICSGQNMPVDTVGHVFLYIFYSLRGYI